LPGFRISCGDLVPDIHRLGEVFEWLGEVFEWLGEVFEWLGEVF